MAANDVRPQDDEFLSSLAEYHESLSHNSVDGEPAESAAGADPGLSARLKRAQDCVRRLHSWGEDETASRLRQPLSGEPDSFPWVSPRSGEIPARVGRFKIVRELGRGAFGLVFLAFDPLLGREIALKLPRPEVVMTPGLCRRFLREAQAAAGLSHPNLVSVFETGEWGPAAYIAMEYCAGETLAAWLERRTQPVSLAAAVALVATLAKALDYAHEHGIIHRDLKPSNVMLVRKTGSDSLPAGATDPDELIPKITDFGLAKLLESGPQETCRSAILGTPTYMAPEQAEGRLGDVGRATDVHALGTILYEIVCGEPPFSGETDMEALKRVALDEPPPLRRSRPDVPRDLEAVCLKCLEKQPSARYQTAQALADDLDRFLAGRSTEARPLGPLGRSLKAARRRPAVAALVAVLVVMGAVGLAGHWWQAANMRRMLVVNALIRDQAEGQKRAAQKEFALAQDQAGRVRQYNYARDVASATAAWKMGRLEEVIGLLSRHRPKPGDVDQREFVWHYLWRLCHAERLSISGHDKPIFSVCYSPDGKSLATACRDGTARLWDAASGRELVVFSGHTGDVNTVSLSPDGRLAATGGDDRTVRLWNIAPPGPRAVCRAHNATVFAVAFSPDSKTLASAGDDELVKLWDTATARERMSLRGHHGRIMAMAFAPAGGLLATVTRDGHCQIWDLGTGRIRIDWQAHSDRIVECVSFSHDGRILATGGEDRKIRIWDPATGALKATLSGHLEVVLSVSFAPDDQTLAAGIKNGTVWRWDVAAAKPLDVIVGHTKRVWDVKFSPDGRSLATASADGTVKLWASDAGKTHRTIAGLVSPPAVVAFSPASQQIAGVLPGLRGEGAHFRSWDLRTGSERGSYLHLDGRMGGIASSTETALAAQAMVQGDGLGVRVVSATDRFWESVAFVLKPPPEQRPVMITCMAISADKHLLATGQTHGKVTLWKLGSGRPMAVMKPEKGHDVCAIRISPDDSLIAAASQDGTVRLWNVAGGPERATLTGHLGNAPSMAFSPDSACLATGSTDRTVKVWSTANGEEQTTLRGHAGELGAVAFSPDGRVLASGSEDGVIKLWDAATWQELASLDAHRGGVRFIAFSPDGALLATSGAAADGRGEIGLWNAAPMSEPAKAK